MPSQELLTAMGNYNEELVKAGILLAGDGLHPSSRGKRVRFSAKDRMVIDGPFTETKELIAGFWLWKVKDMDEAVAWLKRCPNPHDEVTEVEIRPVFEADDFGEAMTPELRAQEERISAELAAGKQDPSSDQAQIRDLVSRWIAAIQKHDLARVTADHTDDITMFDVPPPVMVRGIDAYRQTWPQFFQWLRDNDGTFQLVDLTITTGNTVGYAFALLKCGTREEMTRDDSARLRLTLGLKKIDGVWNIAHEHHSFPASE
jgi:uncharacterized protein (TIGR02246 family)